MWQERHRKGKESKLLSTTQQKVPVYAHTKKVMTVAIKTVIIMAVLTGFIVTGISCVKVSVLKK
jgi:hypothetical protein